MELTVNEWFRNKLKTKKALFSTRILPHILPLLMLTFPSQDLDLFFRLCIYTVYLTTLDILTWLLQSVIEDNDALLLAALGMCHIDFLIS